MRRARAIPRTSSTIAKKAPTLRWSISFVYETYDTSQAFYAHFWPIWEITHVSYFFVTKHKYEKKHICFKV